MVDLGGRAAPRLSRRSILGGLGAGALGAALTSRIFAAPRSSVVLGRGAHTYEWVPGWGKLPEGMSFGNTHGCVVVDSAGRIYVNTDGENAVIVFEPSGRFVRAWGKDLAGGLHGMTLAKEGSEEVLWLAHTGLHEVLQTTLDGKVLRRIGYPEKSGAYASAEQYRPTSVAVAPNGDVYVADGYGLSLIHHYSSKAEFIRSWGGVGSEPGKMRTPHGIFVDVRRDPPVLLVADRENRRIQVFQLDGTHAGFVPADVRRPCNFDRRGDDLAVADLEGRVTILDRKDQVLVHLGDNPDPAKRAQNGVPREEWRDGEFISPHGLRWGAEGNLYVLEWLALGRIVKLRRVS
jgi:hypothetical protein